MSFFGLFGSKDDTSASKKREEPQTSPLPAFASNMMVVVDGSPAGFRAAERAIALAAILGCKLNAAFVVDVTSMDLLVNMHIFVKEERSNFETEMEIKGRRTLEYVKNLGQKYGLEIETYLMKGKISKIIRQAIHELNVDMLTIGGLYNSSTKKDTTSIEFQLLLDSVNIPVLVVK